MTARSAVAETHAAPRPWRPEQPMMSGMHSRAHRIRRPVRTQTRLALSALVMAAGVMVISAADAAGRAGSPGGAWAAAFWLGEVLVFAPAAWRLMSRARPAESEAAGLAIGIALATYLIKYLYSPAAFSFPDELQHWRTTSNLLASHHLFGANYSLPISAVYPGLEEATGALAAVTGLPVFAAGLIVAGLAHLLLTAALYVVFRRVSGSPRIAVAGCVFYAANPHYQSFDAIYGYQTLALGFFGLALVAALELSGHRGRRDTARWWVLGVVLTAATVVTHHVTSYVLGGTLILLAVIGGAERFRARHRGPPARRWGAARVAVLAEACAAAIVLWAGFVAPITRSYLSPAVGDFVHGLAAAFSGHAASTGAVPQGPVADQVANYAAAALIAIGLPLGWWHIWRTHRHHTWALALAAGSAGYYLIALLRVTTPDGAELAGRGLTFFYIPVSYTLAMALDWARRTAPAWRGLRARGYTPAALAALAAVVTLTLVFGGLASGWPPYWERLPGQYVADGFESGITAEGIAAAQWTRTGIGPGRRVAADFTSNGLLGSYGDQNPVSGVDGLYCGGAQWTAADAALATADDVQYVLVDLRTSAYAPDPRGYFGDSSPSCPLTAIPVRNLQKFAAIPGADRVYDSGNIIIYALPGGQNAP